MALVIKWYLRRANFKLKPKNIACITTIISLEGIEKIKTENKKQNRVKK